MNDQQLASRRLKYVRRLKKRVAEYDEYAAVLERGTRRLVRVAPFARDGELHRIVVYVRTAAEVFARAESACTAIGATSARAVLEDARTQILAAFDRFLEEVACGNVRLARAILMPPLRVGSGAFRQALQTVAG